jgi:hypothetical protein
MARIHADRPLDPTTLTAAERDRLAEDLYVVQVQIFGGVSYGDFRAYVVDSPAQRTRIQRFYDADTNELVGFAATHVFTMEVDGRTTDVLRAEVGLLEGYRGQSAAGMLLLKEGARLALRSLFRPAYFLACPVHPASYLAVARGSSHAWPRPEAETPAEIQVAMSQLDHAIGLQRPTDLCGSGVRKVGWVTRQSMCDQAFWANHSDEKVRFYIDQNPGYVQGDGLLIVVPVHARSTVEAVSNYVRIQLRRALRKSRRSAPVRDARPVAQKAA